MLVFALAGLMVIVGLVGLAPSLLQPLRGQRAAPELEAYQADRRRLAVFKRPDPLPSPEPAEPAPAEREPAVEESEPAKGPGALTRLLSRIGRPSAAAMADDESDRETETAALDPVLTSFPASEPGRTPMTVTAPPSPFPYAPAEPAATPFLAAAPPPTAFPTASTLAPTGGSSAGAFEAAFGESEQAADGSAGEDSDDLMSLFRESKPTNVIPESLQGTIERVSIAELLADVRATRDLLAPMIERAQVNEE